MIDTENSLKIPVGRRSVRRILVVLYWLLMAICATKLLVNARHPDIGWQLAIQMMVVLTGSLGGIKPGGLVKGFGRTESESVELRLNKKSLIGIDERESAAVNRVHRIAYRAAMFSALGLLLATSFLCAAHPEWALPLLFSSLILLTVELWSLPQSILLWTEPDLDVEE